MTRLAVLFALAAAPAAAQVTVPEFGLDAVEPGVLSCDLDGTEVGCMIETAEAVGFCMAVDAAGTPLANSLSVSDDGVAIFRNVDPTEIAALRCRPV